MHPAAGMRSLLARDLQPDPLTCTWFVPLCRRRMACCNHRQPLQQSARGTNSAGINQSLQGHSGRQDSFAE